MKNLFSFKYCWLAIAGVAILACSSQSQQAPTHITIIHTNDMHGGYLPTEASWEPERPLIGGFAALGYYVGRERSTADRSLLFDSGDLMTGTLICDMKYKDVYGGSLIAMMNRIGYDGWVFGNHDFDKGADNLQGLIRLAEFPVYCANLIKRNDSTEQLFAQKAYHIYNLDGLRVGVIGITYHQMVGMVPPEKLNGFVSIDPAPVVNQVVSEIDPQTDLIIVLSHLGIDNDRKLAEHVGGVDLILGGHSHTRLDTLEKVNGVLIGQSGSNCRNLGRIDLVIAGDSIMSSKGHLIPMYTEGIAPDPVLAAMVDSIKMEIDKDYAVVIANLVQPWETQYRAESNIGDWITDAMRSRFGTDVAILNSGGIRRNLPAGPVKKMDIHEILPFDNMVVIFSLTGRELIRIAESNVGLEKDSYQGSLQLSGLTYAWAEKDGKIELADVRIGGQPVDPNKVYAVTSIDYVAVANAEKYLGLDLQDVKDTGLSLTQLVLEAVEKAGTIDSKIEGRMKKLSQ